MIFNLRWKYYLVGKIPDGWPEPVTDIHAASMEGERGGKKKSGRISDPYH